MTAPRHNNGDRSSGRSAGSTAARGVALLVAAVVLGVVLLQATDSPSTTTSAPPDQETTVAEVTTTIGSGGVGTDSTPSTLLPGETTTIAGSTGTHAPADVKVLVLNGSGIPGAAGKVAEVLRPAGWNVLPPGNTAKTGLNSVVYYAPGYEAEGTAIATTLKVKAEPFPPQTGTGSTGDANVVVVVGRNMANEFADVTTVATSAPSTTAPASAATSTTTL